MNHLQGVIHRYKDWRHERYIHRLSRKMQALMAVRDRALTRAYWVLFVIAIKRRSAGQVARMEVRLGLR